MRLTQQMEWLTMACEKRVPRAARHLCAGLNERMAIAAESGSGLIIREEKDNVRRTLRASMPLLVKQAKVMTVITFCREDTLNEVGVDYSWPKKTQMAEGACTTRGIGQGATFRVHLEGSRWEC